MKFKLFALAPLAVLALAAGQANAATYDLGTLTGSAFTQTGGSTASNTGVLFEDAFTFSIGAKSTVFTNAVTSSFLGGAITGGVYSIYGAGSDGLFHTLDDVAVSPVAYTISGAQSPQSFVLNAGSYYIGVQGKAWGPVVATYAVTASATALPVPEPETYALLGAGLGIVGFVASRRRRND